MSQPNASGEGSLLDKIAAPFAKFTPAGEKNWIVALLLAFFVGYLGVHNFYLGYTKRGVLQLGLTVIGLITSIILIGGIIVFAVGLWALYEFVLIAIGKGDYAHDANGVPLAR